MAKKLGLSGSSEGKQTALDGTMVKDDQHDDSEDLAILKSALQKSIRKGEVAKAMYFALRLAEKNSWSAWRRLTIISVEDVGEALETVAVDVLFKQFLAFKKQQSKDEKGLSWDIKRCVVEAAKLLAQACKDRRSDEFLELLEKAEKHGEGFHAHENRA